MVPCQARFRYVYNPGDSYDSYCNPTLGAMKHLSNSSGYNLSYPTVNNFNVLAGLDRTSLISPRRSNVLIARSNPKWRRKRGRVRYKNAEEGTERVKLLQAESTGNLCQRLAGPVLEHTDSPANEDQDNANRSQFSTSIPSHFAKHTPYGLKGSSMGLILPDRIFLDAQTKLAVSKRVLMPAFNRGVTPETLSTSICLPKYSLNSLVPALTTDALSKPASEAPWFTSIYTQELGMNYSFACVAKNAVTTILSTSPSQGDERDRFPRLCHTHHFSATRIMLHHEGLANSAFTNLQFTTNWAKCDHSTTYKSPTSLLEPQSAFYYHRSGHLRKTSWAAGVAYFCCTLSNSALMESLNSIRSPPTAALPVYTHQNCKVRNENFPFLSHPFEHSIPQTCNSRTVRLGTKLTPGLMINGYRNNSLAQQVDSIFANRNPRVRRLLYCGLAKSARYPWLERKFETPSINLASVSIYHVPEETHSHSKDPSEDVDPDGEWVCISHQNRKRSHLSILSDIWHRQPSMAIDSSLLALNPIPVIVRESCGFEIMEDIDEDSDLESDEEYELVQPNADDGILKEWEAISALSARTSHHKSDDESLWEEGCEAGL